MRVQLQNDAFTDHFAKHLSVIGNGKMIIDESKQSITLLKTVL